MATIKLGCLEITQVMQAWSILTNTVLLLVLTFISAAPSTKIWNVSLMSSMDGFYYSCWSLILRELYLDQTQKHQRFLKYWPNFMFYWYSNIHAYLCHLHLIECQTESRLEEHTSRKKWHTCTICHVIDKQKQRFECFYFLCFYRRMTELSNTLNYFLSKQCWEHFHKFPANF